MYDENFYDSERGLKGGGVHPDFFVKFDLEIAIDQQTKACDQTLCWFFAIIWTQNPQLGIYWVDDHRECVV